MNTSGTSIANHESGLPTGQLSMPGERDSLIVGPDDRILVTGATGFIGSRVLECLLDRGFHNLVCLVRPGSKLSGIEAIAQRRPRQVVRGWDIFIIPESEIVVHLRAILQPSPQRALPQASRTRPAGSGSIR